MESVNFDVISAAALHRSTSLYMPAARSVGSEGSRFCYQAAIGTTATVFLTQHHSTSSKSIDRTKRNTATKSPKPNTRLVTSPIHEFETHKQLQDDRLLLISILHSRLSIHRYMENLIYDTEISVSMIWHALSNSNGPSTWYSFSAVNSVASHASDSPYFRSCPWSLSCSDNTSREVRIEPCPTVSKEK